MHKQPILGAHMSISGGLEQAILRAQALGCTAVQFFSKSNRQWHAKPLTEGEVTLFKKTRADSPIQSIIIHASYLINLGSPAAQTAMRSQNALKDEFMRACLLDADYLVFHPGSHVQSDETACLERIAEHINSILEQVAPCKTKLVLETMAGQGSGVCHTFEQIAYIMHRIKQKERLGVCLDTCHIFAAGYDLKHAYHETMEQFDAILGLNNLAVIHVNDSKKEMGSHVDRHEHIGQGRIGLEAFKQLMNDSRLNCIPKILETPKESDLDDARNLAIIKGLIHKE